MSANTVMWMEVIFNVAYLVTIWTLVILMVRDRDTVAPDDKAVAQRIHWMFILLALGDSGHVGFRVLAYGLGGLEANPALVGLGALATAVTVTFFYMLLVDVWRIRYQKPLGIFGGFLLSMGVLRLIIMALPGNDWGQVVPPQPMSLVRNLPLMILGLGIMFLILRDAYAAGDRPFQWIGWCILVSYAFYIPVILFVQQVPILGMLMIPKTLAYVAIGVIAYRALFHPERAQVVQAPGD